MAKAERQPKRRSKGRILTKLLILAVLVAIGLGLVLAVLVYAAFVSGPAQVGYCRYMMENRQGSSRVGTLFSAFRVPYGNVVRVQFLVGMLVLAGCILFVVPGIFLHYRYRMVPYLLAENPYLPAGRAMQLSRRMMHGEKWHAFLLDLSFLGWYLLCVLTLGFGLVFLEPYRMVTNAELYALLRSKAFAYGYTGESELGHGRADTEAQLAQINQALPLAGLLLSGLSGMADARAIDPLAPGTHAKQVR